MSEYIEWGALTNIIVVSLLVGAGLPALFAIAVRSLEAPHARRADGTRPAWRVTVAIVCLSIVLATVIGTVVYIAAGGH